MEDPIGSVDVLTRLPSASHKQNAPHTAIRSEILKLLGLCCRAERRRAHQPEMRSEARIFLGAFSGLPMPALPVLLFSLPFCSVTVPYLYRYQRVM